MNGRSAVLASVLLFAVSTAFAQQESGGRPGRDSRPTSRPSAPAISTAPAPGASTVSRPSPGVARNTVRTLPLDSPESSSSGGGIAVPVQSYGGGSYYSNEDWYRCNLFLGRLYSQYSFLPVGDYLWRYAQGDAALTPEAIRFALRDSLAASGSLQQLGQDLNDLIEAYSRGDITQAEFSTQLAGVTKEIRNSAKKIRKDYFLDYLDQGPTGNIPDYDRPESLDQLRALGAELQQASGLLDDVINGYLDRDTTRVVSVSDLQVTSTDTLSKQVDRLAKVIEKSGRKL